MRAFKTLLPVLTFYKFKKRFEEDYVKLKQNGFNSYLEEFKSYL